MSAPEQLDRAHRANRKRFWISWSALAVVVAALVRQVVATSGHDSGSLATMLLVGGAAVAVTGAVVLAMSRKTGGRHAAVAAVRPESDVFEVWGAAGLRAALVAEGVVRPRVRAHQGTDLTVSTTTTGFELWAGGTSPQLLLAVPWRDVTTVTEGAGVVANVGARPAVVIVIATGNELVVLPARRSTGSLTTAALPAVRDLVARLESLRAGA